MSDEINPYEPPADVTGGAPRGRAEAEGQITETMLESLRRTRPWALLISILNFIAGGCSLLGGLGLIVAALFESYDQGAMIAGGAFYLVIAAVYLVIAFYLVRYVRAIGAVNRTGRGEQVEDALWTQQQFWKAAGIIAIALIALVMLGAVGLIVAVAAFGI